MAGYGTQSHIGVIRCTVICPGVASRAVYGWTAIPLLIPQFPLFDIRKTEFPVLQLVNGLHKRGPLFEHHLFAFPHPEIFGRDFHRSPTAFSLDLGRGPNLGCGHGRGPDLGRRSDPGHTVVPETPNRANGGTVHSP